ncbi:hypothetical protein [Curtobacterium sp. ISL-83]|uniref:hypothetical protein n=1 Tax=Curtobacterium sp. ISL-83 TaxID=2819145 RepID=UPI001BE5DE31|nr:hypothetical protein [Curtobacterium sp. ISL-83]MBT2503056.1 hypothetical protein [Curtobacterium sp. ISL-83]
MVVTDLCTTAVDVALRHDQGHAIVVLDAVLRRGIDKAALVAELESRSTRRGRARARALIELADAEIESPGESIAHLVMRDLGLPEPELQHEFHGPGGFLARVDFWFPDHGVVVEFDGVTKYRDRAVRGDLTAEDVVVAEKFREDQLRRLVEVNSVARLTWRDVMPGGEAPPVLRRAGLPVPRAIHRTPAW